MLFKRNPLHCHCIDLHCYCIDLQKLTIASYDRAIEIKPYFHEAWYNRGVELGKLGRLEEAIASYDNALKIKPNHPEAWTNRGIKLNRLSLHNEALVSFKRPLAINPNFPEVFNAWIGLGNTLYN